MKKAAIIIAFAATVILIQTSCRTRGDCPAYGKASVSKNRF
jgi:hypothetical protein